MAQTWTWSAFFGLVVGASVSQAAPAVNRTGEVATVSLPCHEAMNVTTRALVPSVVGTKLRVPARVAYDELRVAHVVSPVSGRVEQVLVGPGERVRINQVLATIHSPDFATARADWYKSVVALDTARRDLKRQDLLFKQHAAPEQVVLAAWDAYKRALSERDRARGNLQLFGGTPHGHKDDAYTLRTPIGGVVMSRDVHAGTEVAGQYGGGSAQELFLVADLSQIWVVADVPEAELGRIHKESPVTVQIDALPNTTLYGMLDYASETLDPNTHRGRVRCSVPNVSGKLKPDMFATITMATTGEPALVVERKSVLTLGDAAFVFVELPVHDQNHRVFERRHVVLDDVDETDANIFVKFGLRERERVVVSGTDVIAHRFESEP